MRNRLQKIEKAINNMSDDKFNELLNDLGVKEEKQWVPEHGEEYWCFMVSGGTFTSYWTNTHSDHLLLLMKNVFKTEEEAKAQRDFNIEKAKLIKEIEDSSDVIDWEDEDQYKYTIYYDYNGGIFNIEANRWCENQGSTYTTNKRFLENLIKNKSERIKKYLFGIGE